jgi:hypothetical protein
MTKLPDDFTAPPSSQPHAIRVLFGPYEVTLALGPRNELLGIQQIAISQDFRSQKQKLDTLGFHDVGTFYDEESQ